MTGGARDGAGVLLDASPDGSASAFVQAATGWVRCVAVEAGPSLLVRPDACAAWIGEGQRTDGLEQALDR